MHILDDVALPVGEGVTHKERFEKVEKCFFKIDELLERDQTTYRHIVAVGDCTMDFIQNLDVSVEIQLFVFQRHFDLACKFDLPFCF
jgi:Tat protein secretion system quality control protein TatD with DNase activity